ncbi:MAG: hypothetical protein EP338_12370 [Bacteroidetes bacterium]|nr:MAG: hypothetical protein EP338_12370 [Bacteroidota bacterium]
MLSKLSFTSLKTILIVAFAIRLVSCFFSEGYGMHDDHFLVIEASGSWVDGGDYNNWLPWNKESGSSPEGHSFTYVGSNYLLFKTLKFVGLEDPKLLMFFNRLAHALLSLLVIYFGFRITEKLSDRKTAALFAWTWALLWFVPFISVRNLVEVVSIPFVVWSAWKSLSTEQSQRSFLVAGILIGIAISIRYQIALYAIGVGIYYLFRGAWKQVIFYTIGFLIAFSLTQGLVDYFIWGYPFAEFLAYVNYNMNEGTQYMSNTNYFMYFYVLFGLLLIPFGILALIAYFRASAKYLVLFLPTFIFLVFHSIFPNRQERFILTILPIVLILVFLGIRLLIQKKGWQKFWKISWVSFWVLNVPLLLIVSVAPTKKTRIDSMYYLYGKVKGNEHILMESSGETAPNLLPRFYAGKWNFTINERSKEHFPDVNSYLSHPHDYVFFNGNERLEERIAELKQIYPQMKMVKQIHPSFIDETLHRMNPRNSNTYVEIWKTNFR